MAPAQLLWIDRDDDTPVYAQIARQIRSRVAGGELRAGDALPSVRVLASDLGVNLNTVARAYRLLEDEGFVEIRDRSGAVVTAPAARPAPGAKEILRERLRETLARMRQAGMTVEEIDRATRQEIGALDADSRRPR